MITFVKNNWKYLVLILVIIFLLKDRVVVPSRNASYELYDQVAPSAGGVAKSLMAPLLPIREEVAPTDSQDRLVIKDTSLSLVLKNVTKSINDVETAAKNFGGFLVNSYLSRPEEGGSGNITIRVPEARRTEALNAFRGLAVKVVSESIYGNDVTDEYVDLASRLEVLLQTKTKFQEIMTRATAINDLLNVQRELISLQQQIDSIKGQQKYYEQSAKLSKITVYLSTDELSLPYAPTDAWRPAVIFKTAIRSLVSNLRSLGTATIWLLVYSPILLVGIIVYRWLRKRSF